jgi:hypothetical protein
MASAAPGTGMVGPGASPAPMGPDSAPYMMQGERATGGAMRWGDCLAGAVHHFDAPEGSTEEEGERTR